MMRRINIVGILISIILLTGCSLAVENDVYDDNDDTQEVEYYKVSRFDFEISRGRDTWELLENTDEFFYVNFVCPNMTVFDNCRSTDVGKSIEVNQSNTNVAINYINDEEQPVVTTETIELTFYFREDRELTFYPIIVSENMDGDEKIERQIGMMADNNATYEGSIETEDENGNIDILEFKLHFVAVDALHNVTIKQFDENDDVILTTMITEDDLLSELTLDSRTAYYLIIEDYTDEEDVSYQVRTFIEPDAPFYFLYKFTNEDGFLDGERLVIQNP